MGKGIDPSSTFNDCLTSRRRQLARLVRSAQFIGYLRGAAGVSFPATLWLALAVHAIPLWFGVIPATVFLLIHCYYERAFRKLNRTKRGIEFYESGLARIENRWAGSGTSGARFVPMDHL